MLPRALGIAVAVPVLWGLSACRAVDPAPEPLTPARIEPLTPPGPPPHTRLDALRDLLGVDPDAHPCGSYAGDYHCAELAAPVAASALDGPDAPGLVSPSTGFKAWMVRFRFAPRVLGKTVEIAWRGWHSRPFPAPSELEIFANHDESNDRELGTWDSEEDRGYRLAPDRMRVSVEGRTYLLELRRRQVARRP